MEAYAAAKCSLFRNMRPTDVAMIPAGAGSNITISFYNPHLQLTSNRISPDHLKCLTQGRLGTWAISLAQPLQHWFFISLDPYGSLRSGSSLGMHMQLYSFPE